jgi:hypothetical protein
MIKTGGILAIIAGLLGLLAGFVTLFLGGLGSAFSASGFGDVVSLGWGGILFSLLVVIYGGIAISKPKPGATGIILSAILGMALGGTLVAILMILALIGGIMAAIGKPKEAPLQGQKRWHGMAIAAIAPILCAVFIGGKLVSYDKASTNTVVAANQTLQIGQTAHSDKFEVTVRSIQFTEVLGEGFTETRADPDTVFAVIEVNVRCVDKESRFYNSGDLYAEVNGTELKYDNSEVILGLDSPIGMINPLTEKTGFVVYKIPQELAGAKLSWMPGMEFSDLRFNLTTLPLAQTAKPAAVVGDVASAAIESATITASVDLAGIYISPNLGTLTIKQQPNGTLEFLLEVVSEQGNTGEATGVLVSDGSLLTYKDAEMDCLLTLSPLADSMQINQEGICGFGMNVVADGNYLKQAQP